MGTDPLVGRLRGRCCSGALVGRTGRASSRLPAAIFPRAGRSPRTSRLARHGRRVVYGGRIFAELSGVDINERTMVAALTGHSIGSAAA
jgi:hypothetical protein